MVEPIDIASIPENIRIQAERDADIFGFGAAEFRDGHWHIIDPTMIVFASHSSTAERALALLAETRDRGDITIVENAASDDWVKRRDELLEESGQEMDDG